MIATFPKQFKELQEQYNKKLLAEHKANFSILNNNMDYFITYLKYLRDYYLLTNDKKNIDELVDIKTTTLVAAVSEYEKYNNCISKYYKLENNKVERLTDEPEEEVAKKYNNERKFH